MTNYNETITGRKTPKLNVEAIMNKPEPKKEKTISPLRARILAEAKANADKYGR